MKGAKSLRTEKEKETHSPGAENDSVDSHEKEKIVHKDYLKAFYYNYPKNYRSSLEKEAVYAGIYDPIDRQVVIITRFFLFLFLAMLVFINMHFAIPPVLFLIGFIFSAFASFFIPYMIYTIMAENRKVAIEEVLPDLLILASSNIKSGYTIDKALLFSARKEFGALSVEVKKTAFMIYSGTGVEPAFSELTSRIKSVILERVIKLLIEGMKNGGQVATLLEESSNDIERGKVLQKEINSSIQMYLIFIIIAGVIASPVMFAISSYLISSTTAMWTNLGGNFADTKMMGGGIITISPKAPDIQPGFFDTFAVASIFITTLFAGFVISLIKNGNIKGALNYSPFFVVFSIALFLIAKNILFTLMGGL